MHEAYTLYKPGSLFMNSSLFMNGILTIYKIGLTLHEQLTIYEWYSHHLTKEVLLLYGKADR